MPRIDPEPIDHLLQTLTGVVRARVHATPERDGLTEIHILSDGAIAPKQIVRNIETLLKTAFDLPIDHRIVSIAVLKPEAGRADVDALDAPGPLANGAGRAVVRTEDPRVVFLKLRVLQEEPLKCTARVELKLGDVIFEGSHRDTDTPRARMYASARAVIEALEYLSEKEMAFYLAGLERMRVFQKDVLVVCVEGRRDRAQVRMLGTAMVEDDVHEAAVRAVLDAVNRFLARPAAGAR